MCTHKSIIQEINDSLSLSGCGCQQMNGLGAIDEAECKRRFGNWLYGNCLPTPAFLSEDPGFNVNLSSDVATVIEEEKIHQRLRDNKNNILNYIGDFYGSASRQAGLSTNLIVGGVGLLVVAGMVAKKQGWIKL
jgi:hypothetical protein